MPILTQKDFFEKTGTASVLLGLDIGGATIGVAYGSGLLRLATPVKTIRRGKIKADGAEIEKIRNHYGAVGFVIGWPLNMDGSEGPRCQATKDIALELAKNWPVDIPLLFWDERLSTSQAYENLKETGAKRKSSIIDGAAAQVILQSYLDSF